MRGPQGYYDAGAVGVEAAGELNVKVRAARVASRRVCCHCCEARQISERAGGALCLAAVARQFATRCLRSAAAPQPPRHNHPHLSSFWSFGQGASQMRWRPARSCKRHAIQGTKGTSKDSAPAARPAACPNTHPPTHPPHAHTRTHAHTHTSRATGPPLGVLGAPHARRGVGTAGQGAADPGRAAARGGAAARRRRGALLLREVRGAWNSVLFQVALAVTHARTHARTCRTRARTRRTRTPRHTRTHARAGTHPPTPPPARRPPRRRRRRRRRWAAAAVALCLERRTFSRAELDALLGPQLQEDQPARWAIWVGVWVGDRGRCRESGAALSGRSSAELDALLGRKLQGDRPARWAKLCACGCGHAQPWLSRMWRWRNAGQQESVAVWHPHARANAGETCAPLPRTNTKALVCRHRCAGCNPAPRFRPGDLVRVLDENAPVRWRRPHLRTPGYIFGLIGAAWNAWNG